MDPSWTGFLESQPTVGFERGRSKLSGSSPSRVLAGAILSFWFLKRREVSGLDVVRVRRAPPAPSRERKARAAERSGAAGLALRGAGMQEAATEWTVGLSGLRGRVAQFE